MVTTHRDITEQTAGSGVNLVGNPAHETECHQKGQQNQRLRLFALVDNMLGIELRKVMQKLSDHCGIIRGHHPGWQGASCVAPAVGPRSPGHQARGGW